MCIVFGLFGIMRFVVCVCVCRNLTLNSQRDPNASEFRELFNSLAVQQAHIIIIANTGWIFHNSIYGNG